MKRLGINSEIEAQLLAAVEGAAVKVRAVWLLDDGRLAVTFREPNDDHTTVIIERDGSMRGWHGYDEFLYAFGSTPAGRGWFWDVAGRGYPEPDNRQFRLALAAVAEHVGIEDIKRGLLD